MGTPCLASFWLACLLIMAAGAATAASNTLTVAATVLSKSQSQFSSTNSALNFGNVDATTIATITFKGAGNAPQATYRIAQNGAASGTTAAPRNEAQTITVRGTVTPTDYAGIFRRTVTITVHKDSVTITITP